MSNSSRTRVDQVRYDVTDPARQPIWLAGEIDELDSSTATAIDELRVEFKKVRQVLTGLLVSICLALIVVPVTVLLRT